ncbi:IS3 family transposase [Pontibacter korlensis]
MVEEHGVSVRQACKAAGVARSTFEYKPVEKDDSQIEEQLQLLVEKHPAIGFWQCFHRIRRKGHEWNHKRVYRVYSQLRLNIRRRHKKRLPARVKQALFQPDRINQVWSVDFMSDSLWDGRKFRLLNIVDDYNREILTMEADLSIPALRLVRVLRVPQRVQGAAGDDPGGQRAGVYLPETGGLVQGEQGEAGVHPAWQAHAERLR